MRRMSVPSGTRLGPYEVVAPFGAGGMGEVYRARDTRLDRIVAIKVLPEAVATDREFRECFERERDSALAQQTRTDISHGGMLGGDVRDEIDGVNGVHLAPDGATFAAIRADRSHDSRTPRRHFASL
jgi:serine/threonine protein kinase